MLDRYRRWSRRLAVLPPWGELWRDLSDHPAYQWVLDQDGDPQYYLTRELLRDVVHAAGGMEYSLEKLLASLAAAQRYVDENRDTIRPPSADEPWPPGGVHLSHDGIDSAFYEFLNFIWWTRALRERLWRRARGGDVQLGLVPSMNPDHPAAARVQVLFEQVKAAALDYARNEANYTLHASALPNPMAPADLTRDATVTIRVPGELIGDEEIFDQLPHSQSRDALEVATDIMRSVEKFMDGLLDVFEDADEAARRLRGTGPQTDAPPG